MSPEERRPRVVVLGGGFGGLNAARALKAAPVEVLLIDRTNHHLFQPLLYQVATAALDPSEIAAPLRNVLGKQANCAVVMHAVEGVDVERRQVRLTGVEEPIDYDYLVVATGARHAYFGHDEYEALAPGLKSLDDALEIRSRFLTAFENAEQEGDPDARTAELTFVVIGGGPTGVELAGAMAEIARNVLPAEFRAIDTHTARVLLLEGSPRILGAFPPECSEKAKRHLEQLGVEVRTETRVTDVQEWGVMAGDERIPAKTVLWAAGVHASPIGASLGAETDRAGRVKVGPDLTIAGHPEVFVVGDLAAATDAHTGGPVPGVAQGAIQTGRYAAARVAERVRAAACGAEPPAAPPFAYHDKGSLATIGRGKAVAALRGKSFGGRVAWVLWAVVHLTFLVSFHNRVAVMLSWMWNYCTHERGARAILGESRVRTRKEQVPEGTERE